MYTKEDFIRKCSALGVTITDHQYAQYLKYYEMLVEKNKVMNLTAITEYDEVLDKHFIDSLSIVKAVDLNQVTTIMDVGTGAGFPGIPLKIAFPHLKITLLDSLNKRIKFIQEVVDELGLADVTLCHGRAEDFGHKAEYRQQFDICTSRAVANLTTLTEYCLPFVNKGGQFISYKSGDVDEELKASEKAVAVLGGKIGKVVSFNLPETDLSRTMVPVKKVGPTPGKYPRKAGTPSKEPIK